MKKELKFIYNAVYNHIAPARSGIIELKEIYRMFSNYCSSLKDAEECLDEFLKQQAAKKVSYMGEKIYIFPKILTDAIQSIESKQTELSKQSNSLRIEHSELNNEIEAISRLENLWLQILDKHKFNKEIGTDLQNYVSSFFIGSGERVKNKTKELQEKLNVIERNIDRLEKRKRKLHQFLNFL